MSNSPSQPMNLIVVCFDTLRHDFIRHTGVDWIETPNMDRMARESVIFSQCYAEGLPTLPVRRAFFTGMRSFPWRWDINPSGLWPTLRGWHGIPPDQPTLAEILLERGYTSGLIGDTLHMFKTGGNFTRGFTGYEWIRGQESDSWRTGPLSKIDMSKYVRPGQSRQTVRMLTQYLLNIQDRRAEDDYFCAQVAASATRWLEDNAELGPLFLWVDFFDPHEPWDPPMAYADRYYSGYEGPEPIHTSPFPEMPPAMKERVKALYAGEVTFADVCFGRIWDAVERLGLMDNSILMLVSDHGTELFEHGGTHKGANKLFPYINKIHWMIRHPKADLRDRRVEAFTQDHDLFPTALRLLGVDCPPVEGVDVWPLATGEGGPVRDHVVTGFGDFACVRDEEWNCQIRYEAPNAPAKLFHHAEDMAEKIDVATKYPDVVARQKSRLEALLGQTLPARPMDKTYPSAGPYVQRYENLVKQGRAADWIEQLPGGPRR